MNNIIWIENWFISQCNDDWEHNFGIKIETIDNPGWSITIDTIGTDKKIDDRDWVLYEQSDEDWYGYKVKDGQFDGAGDPTKLNKLIDLFIDLVS